MLPIEKTREDLKRIVRGIEGLIEATRGPFAPACVRKLLDPEKALVVGYEFQSVLDHCWHGEALSRLPKPKKRAAKEGA